MMESTRSTPGPGQRETDQSSRLTQNNSNTPGGRPGGSAPQGTPPTRRVSWLRWLIFIIVINLIFYAPLLFSGLGAQQSTINLSYTSFLQQVQQGHVKDVTLTGNAVSGDFKTPLRQPQSGSGNGTAAYTQFSSYVPETGDPTLLPLLEKNGVHVTAQPVQIPWWQTALTILLNALPLLLLVYFGYMALRSVQQSQQGGGIFGVGRSRAKLYNEERPSTTFADVAGVDEAKADLREVIDFLRNPQRYLAIGAHIPKGVLLVGPPGTGKTLLARAVAGEANVPFFSINGSEFVEMFVGVGAARVRDLFEQAHQKAPCIIFIDELDALGRARSSYPGGGGHDEKEQTLNQLLSELDGFDTRAGIVLLAATNRPEILDPALLRAGRFDRQVLVDRPDRIGRDQILKVHTRKVILAVDVKLEEVAALTPGFTGADLANLVNEAALVATRRGAGQVGMNDFNLAIERIVAGLEKKNRLLNPREREIVAHHEMGHAFVAAALPGSDAVHKVSIIPRGIGSLGYTIQRPTEDRFLMTRPELENKMSVLLGGRGAEQLIFGEISTGAADDIQKVTNIARSMVTRYGMIES